MGLYRLFRRMKIPLPPSAAAAVAVMVLYGKMTGMGASSFRAICMFLLHMAALVLHRTYDLLTALSLAGVLLLIQQPLYLLDSGFQFSFGAVLGIALLSPAFESKVMKTLAVTLAVIPVYLISYGTFPIYSILLNLAVLPLMSVVMLSGLGTLAAGCILPALGRGAGFVTHLILLFYKTLCQLSMRLPGHQMNVGAPEAWEIIFYLGALAAVVCAKDFLPEMVKAGTVAAALLVLCLRVQSGLDVYVLDVGQGDGLLLRQGGTNILIDGGSTSKSSLSQYQLTPFLANRGITRLDYCIVTHEDEDHMNGVIEVIRGSRTHRDGAAGFLLDDSSDGITVGALCLPSCDPQVRGENYQLLLDAAEEKRIPVRFLSEGDVVSQDRKTAEESPEQSGSEHGTAARGVSLICLHPEQDSQYEEPNERSVVLELTYGKFSMLLTGDLEGEGEKRLLEYLQSRQDPQQGIHAGTGNSAAADSEPAGSEEREVTLLKVAHHGSSGATSREFLDVVSPRYAVISCGVNNRYHHPSQETLERLEEAGVQKIYDTRYGGEICFHNDGEKLTVKEKGGELD